MQAGPGTGVADAVNDVLRGVQEPGGFGNAGLNLDQPSAGKTGTTDAQPGRLVHRLHPEPRDRLDDRRRQLQGRRVTLNGQTVGGSYISGAAGSTTAGPMWGDAMKAIERYIPDRLPLPDPQTIQGQTVSVPSVYGLGIGPATESCASRASTRWSDPGWTAATPRAPSPTSAPLGAGRDREHRDDLRLRRHAGLTAPKKKHHEKPSPGSQARAAYGGAPPGLAQGGAAATPGELATYLRGHGGAVRPTLTCGCEGPHHLAHRAHAVAGRAELADDGGDQVGDLLLVELLGQVVADHDGLRPLLVGAVTTTHLLERLGCLTTLLGLACSTL